MVGWISSFLVLSRRSSSSSLLRSSSSSPSSSSIVIIESVLNPNPNELNPVMNLVEFAPKDELAVDRQVVISSEAEEMFEEVVIPTVESRR